MSRASLHIGAVKIDPPLVLGPMAGYTTLAFRLLCHNAGAGLVVSEMISAKALQYGSTKTPPLMETCPQERPVALQIFGGEPESMADAARLCVEMGANVVDINMGCTVPKVRRSQSGVGLMCDPDRAVAVAAAVVQAIAAPVMVKFRAGMVVGDDSYLELGKRLQDVGVAALSLHARPASAYFRGHADWTHVARLVETVDIPVIGNGDVTTGQDAVRRLRETGCAGIMIARGALGRPWVFHEAREALAGRTDAWEPTGPERLAVALWQAQMLALQFGDISAARQMRSQMSFYVRGLPEAGRLRQRFQGVRSVGELADVVWEYLERTPCSMEEPTVGRVTDPDGAR
ncbi:MAG: tRNA dihydrouridine synthase DusB [Armatimonadia bacterium]